MMDKKGGGMGIFDGKLDDFYSNLESWHEAGALVRIWRKDHAPLPFVVPRRAAGNS